MEELEPTRGGGGAKVETRRLSALHTCHSVPYVLNKLKQNKIHVGDMPLPPSPPADQEANDSSGHEKAKKAGAVWR